MSAENVIHVWEQSFLRAWGYKGEENAVKSAWLNRFDSLDEPETGWYLVPYGEVYGVTAYAPIHYMPLPDLPPR